MKAEPVTVRARKSDDRRGFTIIEVILALALFALCVVVLSGAYVNVLISIESAKTDQALEQDMAFVRTALLTEADLEAVEEGGDVETLTHGTATWTAAVTPTAVADLFRVDFTVEFSGAEDGSTASVTTEPLSVTETLYLLRSDWSEATDRDNLRAETRKRLEELKRTRPL